MQFSSLEKWQQFNSWDIKYLFMNSCSLSHAWSYSLIDYIALIHQCTETPHHKYEYLQVRKLLLNSEQNCKNTFCFTYILLYISETIYIWNKDNIARFNNCIKQFVNTTLQNMSSNATEVEPQYFFFFQGWIHLSQPVPSLQSFWQINIASEPCDLARHLIYRPSVACALQPTPVLSLQKALFLCQGCKEMVTVDMQVPSRSEV